MTDSTKTIEPLHYIKPKVYLCDSVDKLFDNSYLAQIKKESSFDIQNWLNHSFLCIVGEPGIGKTRLMNMLHEASGNDVYYAASEFLGRQIEPKKYCFVDALDEVDETAFVKTLNAIYDFQKANTSINVFFSCRKHYIDTYRSLFAKCKDLQFLEIDRLSVDDLNNEIESYSDEVKNCINANPTLQQLLRVPRYLVFLHSFLDERCELKNIGDLFEYMIASNIKEILSNNNKDKNKEEASKEDANNEDANNEDANNDNIRILIQRALEKIAFVMEIARKDSLSIDELYTILDYLSGNMMYLVISNIRMLFLQNRILKNTTDGLKFENSEFQEYFAAKELSRQINVESVLFDVAVEKDLKHLYPNWYNVLPHLSYSKNASTTFFNLIKLIVSYENNLTNTAFVSLLRYVDPSLLNPQQKKELFAMIVDNFQTKNVSIGWENTILSVLSGCYTSLCDDIISVANNKANVSQIWNITFILREISDIVRDNVKQDWKDKANELYDGDEENKTLAINLYRAIGDSESLIAIASEFNSFSDKLKQTYLEATGYANVVDKDVVQCWISECFRSNPYAINAVLHQKDKNTIFEIYNVLVGKNKLDRFFNPSGSLMVFYPLYLSRQFGILWKEDSEKRKLMAQVYAAYCIHNHHSKNDCVFKDIRTILLDNDISSFFLDCFSTHWDIEELFRTFDSNFIDGKMIKVIDNYLTSPKLFRYRDSIIKSIVWKIRGDEAKKDNISKYLNQYANDFKRMDESSDKLSFQLDNKTNLEEAYDVINNPECDDVNKYRAAYELTKDVNFLENKNCKPFVNVIQSFFSSINLDQMDINKTTPDSFSLNTGFVFIPSFVVALNQLNQLEVLTDNRILLAKTLPTLLNNINDSEVRKAYKQLIGKLTDSEKKELVNWWKSRKDDFMKISSESIIDCIKEYGIEELDYILEEYIADYVNNQDSIHFRPASDALDLIAKSNSYGWSEQQYIDLFDKLRDGGINSLKMSCNAYLIELFSNEKAISWRFDYLMNHPVSVKDDSQCGHLRPVSPAESEITSGNPRMFRCFQNIKSMPFLSEKMQDLFAYALSLLTQSDKHEYAYYLIKNICAYFVNTGESSDFISLRSIVKDQCPAVSLPYVYKTVYDAEELLLQNSERTVLESVRLYNMCLEQSYLPIRNDGDFRTFFMRIIKNVNSEIQDEGIYSLVRQENLSEDFIQRELKNTLINKFCMAGLTAIKVDREVALQDNKRTDILIRYGLCKPIMIELKLLHNKEIQNDTERNDYKNKFLQYSRATKPCLSVFWVFNVYKPGSNKDKFDELKKEYANIQDTIVLLTDCKCSCGKDTGLSHKK